MIERKLSTRMADINKQMRGDNVGRKDDSDKLRYDLIPPKALEGLAKVITFGANKYEPENWKGVEVERYIAAIFRHLQAHRLGELVDNETGLSHMYHIMCNAAFISELTQSDERE